MNGAEVLDVGRDAIWLTIQLSAPVLIVGLVVGVAIGLMQALTQIQEATLVYAPKIVAIFISLLLFLPLMGALMSGFTARASPILLSAATEAQRTSTSKLTSDSNHPRDSAERKRGCG